MLLRNTKLTEMEVTFMELVNLGWGLKKTQFVIVKKHQLGTPIQLYIRLQSFNDTFYFNDADYRIVKIC